MKDKICFSKTFTYLVLLIAVVAGAFYVMNVTNNTQNLGATPKAGTGDCTSSRQLYDSRAKTYTYENIVADGGCEQTAYKFTEAVKNINTGRKCAAKAFSEDLEACPLTCVYGNSEVLSTEPSVGIAGYYFATNSNSSTTNCIYYKNISGVITKNAVTCDSKTRSAAGSNFGLRKDETRCLATEPRACNWNGNPVKFSNQSPVVGELFISVVSSTASFSASGYPILKENGSSDVDQKAKCIPVLKLDGKLNYWYSKSNEPTVGPRNYCTAGGRQVVFIASDATTVPQGSYYLKIASASVVDETVYPVYIAATTQTSFDKDRYLGYACTRKTIRGTQYWTTSNYTDNNSNLQYCQNSGASCEVKYSDNTGHTYTTRINQGAKMGDLTCGCNGVLRYPVLLTPTLQPSPTDTQ